MGWAGPQPLGGNWGPGQEEVGQCKVVPNLVKGQGRIFLCQHAFVVPDGPKG